VQVPDSIAAVFAAVPANRSFGFVMHACGTNGAELGLEPRPEHVQEHGVVHGGVLAALADTAAVYAFRASLEPGQAATSIEFKLNFLRPAQVGAGELRARSRIVRRGRRVCVCDVDVLQGDAPVATGTFTYLFIERGD